LLDAGERLWVLDVRNDDDFAAWQLEAKHPIETVHIPYFEWLEDQGGALDRLPRDGDVIVVCARGESSAMVAEMLRDAGVRASNLEGGMLAYGRHVQPARVSPADGRGGIELWQLHRRARGCLSYVVRLGGDAIVVDPSRDVASYERFVLGIGARIALVLDTHVHADHVSGGPLLAARSGAPYFVDMADGCPDAEQVDLSELCRRSEPAQVFRILEVLRTPGHTPGSRSYLVGDRYLLSGDTLTVRGIGRPDLDSQVVERGHEFFHTLHERFRPLGDGTVVLPAHSSGVPEMGPDDVVSCLLGELRCRPEFQIDSEDAFVASFLEAVTVDLDPPPAAYAEIVRANRDARVVDEEQAAIWEVGKNQCSAHAARVLS